MNQRPKLYICARESEAKEDATNIFLIREDERISFNPVYIKRALAMFKDNEASLISRSAHVSIILEAAHIGYERDY